MRINAKWRCGHKASVDSVPRGDTISPEDRIRWFETHDCVKCCLKDARNLHGTDRDKISASRFRSEFIDSLEYLVKDESERQRISDLAMSIPTAKWWLGQGKRGFSNTIKDLELRCDLLKVRDGIDDSKYPKLGGTSKQVRWAKDIRKMMIAVIKYWTPKRLSGLTDDEYDRLETNLIDWVLGHTTAKWFINNRYHQSAWEWINSNAGEKDKTLTESQSSAINS